MLLLPHHQIGSGGGGSESDGAASPYTPTQGHAGSAGSESGNYGGNGGGAGSAAGNGTAGAGNGVRIPSVYRNPVVAPGPGTGPQVGGGLGSPGPAGGFISVVAVQELEHLMVVFVMHLLIWWCGDDTNRGQSGVTNTGGGGGRNDWRIWKWWI